LSACCRPSFRRQLSVRSARTRQNATFAGLTSLAPQKILPCQLNRSNPGAGRGNSKQGAAIILLGVFQGQNYSYSLDTVTSEYFLFKNDYKAHAVLKGKDARIFTWQLDHLDTLHEPEYKTGLMTENLIKLLAR
jgi:hypothetical protein